MVAGLQDMDFELLDGKTLMKRMGLDFWMGYIQGSD